MSRKRQEELILVPGPDRWEQELYFNPNDGHFLFKIKDLYSCADHFVLSGSYHTARCHNKEKVVTCQYAKKSVPWKQMVHSHPPPARPTSEQFLFRWKCLKMVVEFGAKLPCHSVVVRKVYKHWPFYTQRNPRYLAHVMESILRTRFQWSIAENESELAKKGQEFLAKFYETDKFQKLLESNTKYWGPPHFVNEQLSSEMWPSRSGCCIIQKSTGGTKRKSDSQKELGSRVNGITKSTPSTQEKPSKGLKKRLETSISSDISAEEELSEVDRNTCTNSAAEEDVTSNNNRPMNSVVKVRPNPAKRVRQSTSSLQVSNIKVENKTDKVHQPDPIEGLDELLDAAAASRLLDTNESMMANFFNMRGWLVVDAPKYNKDMQLLKDYKSGWDHVSPTETLSQVLRTLASNGNVEEQQVVALNGETPRPCDQLKQWIGKMVEDATERRQLDPFEKTMASFLSGRGWLVVDGSKYQKDLRILKEYQQCWSHVSPTETLSQVINALNTQISLIS